MRLQPHQQLLNDINDIQIWLVNLQPACTCVLMYSKHARQACHSIQPHRLAHQPAHAAGYQHDRQVAPRGGVSKHDNTALLFHHWHWLVQFVRPVLALQSAKRWTSTVTATW